MPKPIANTLTLTLDGKLDGFQPLHIEATITLEPECAPEPPNPTPTPTPMPTPPPDDTSTLSVEIEYNLTIYSFHENQGTDLGDYREPGGHFVQRCIMDTNPDLPGFRVMFRRDRDSDRLEVVFELGALFSGTPANMGSYTATILRGESMLARIEAPEHYWHSRWRWQSAPRPIIYPKEKYAGSMLPSYSEDLFGAAIPLSNPRSYAGPMDMAGLTAYIPSTGERDEIGLFTEAQGEFLCQGTDVAWASVLAQLEASGTLTWHFRDETTGAPLDWSAYPNATMYSPSGADPYIQNPTSPVVLDVAHEPSLAFLPFLLTGDPYALEAMQFACVYNVVMLSPGARANFNLGNAVRAVAWTLRALAQASKSTPVSVPSWLLPGEIFAGRMDDEFDWFMSRFVGSDQPPFCNLSLVSDGVGAPADPPLPADTWVAPWQEDFLTSVLGWIVGMGGEDWRPVLEWKCLDLMARTNGTSGWVRAVLSPYEVAIRSERGAEVVPHWAAAWDLNASMQPDAVAHDDPDTLPAATNLTYPSYALGALALAARAGVPQAQACYDWLLAQLQANTTASKYTRRKWAMAT